MKQKYFSHLNFANKITSEDNEIKQQVNISRTTI